MRSAFYPGDDPLSIELTQIFSNWSQNQTVWIGQKDKRRYNL